MTEKKVFILKCNLKPSLKGVGAGNLRNCTLKFRIFETQPDLRYSYKKCVRTSVITFGCPGCKGLSEKIILVLLGHKKIDIYQE